MSQFPNLISVRHHKTVNCPDCNCAMTPYLCESAMIDKCDQCGGIWFDHKELTIFQNSIRKHDLSGLVFIEGILDPSEDRYQISNCPRCQQALVEREQGLVKKVNLQVCTICKGQWLRSHQLIQMIDLLKLNQSLIPDVLAVQSETEKLRRERKRNQNLQETSEYLSRPIYTYPYYGFDSDFPKSINGRVVLAIVGLNALVSIIYYFIGADSPEAMSCYSSFYRMKWGLTAAFFYKFLNFSFWSFCFNSMALLLFGRLVERRMGSSFFLAAFVISTMFSSMIERFGICYEGASAVLGLSGLVAGTIGALCIYNVRARIEGFIKEYYMAVNALFLAVIWLIFHIAFMENSLAVELQIMVANFIGWAAVAFWDEN